MEPNPAPTTVDNPAQRQTAPILTNPPTAAVEPSVAVAAPVAPTVIEPAMPVASDSELAAPTEVESPLPPEPVESLPVFTPPLPAKRRLSIAKVLVVLMLMLNLSLLIGNGLVYAHNHQAIAARTVTPAAIAPKTTAATTSSTKSAPVAKNDTLHYKSDSLNLEFDYPIDWRIASTSDNSSINLTSASFPITSSSGESAAGTIDMTISNAVDNFGGYSQLSETSDIVKDSEPLTYTKPTAQQRSQTNISFAGYKNRNGADAITDIFVSGGNVYKAGDKLGSKDFKKVEPHISMYVDLCAGGKCVQALATSDFTLQTWHTNDSLLKAKAVIESMRFN